jgi:hypothetical protein
MWNLARKLLLHDRLRFAVAISGVSVSVMLVLVQVGLYFGFMDTASSIIDASKADIWVGKKGNDAVEVATPFDDRAYYKVASVPGVERAERVLINFAQFKLPDGGDLGVQIVGVDNVPGKTPLLSPWNVVDGDPHRLTQPAPRSFPNPNSGAFPTVASAPARTATTSSTCHAGSSSRSHGPSCCSCTVMVNEATPGANSITC